MRSNNEVRENSPDAFAHSNNVRRNINRSSCPFFSQPSNVRAFLSLQMPHMRQCRIISHITPLSCLETFLCQHAKSSIMENTKSHNSQAKLLLRSCHFLLLLLMLFLVFLYIFSFPQLESTHSFSPVH